MCVSSDSMVECQYVKLEIPSSNPSVDTNFSLSNYHILAQLLMHGALNDHLKIFNLGARRGEDVHFLMARLYITGLD